MRFLAELRANGHEPVVLTVADPDKQFHPSEGPMPKKDEWNGIPVYRSTELKTKWLWQYPSVIISRALKLLGKTVAIRPIANWLRYIDIEYGWIWPAQRLGRKLVKQYKPDLIHISCPPFSSTAIALKLAEEFNLPLVMDYRDSWTVSPYMFHSRPSLKLEDRLLNRVNGVVVTTPTDQTRYQQLVIQKGREDLTVTLIPNGYDPVFTKVAAAPASSTVLRLLYLGDWDDAARNPAQLLNALSSLSIPWLVHSLGNTNQLLLDAAKQLNLEHNVKCEPAKPKDQLGQAIEECHALFLQQGYPKPGMPNTHIAAKTYDYIATGRPILAFAALGDNLDMLAKHAPQLYLADPAPENTNERTQAVSLLANDFTAQKLKYAPANQDFLQEFSTQAQTQALAEVHQNAVRTLA